MQQRFAFGTSIPLSVLDGSSDHRQILFLRHSASLGAPQDIDLSIVDMLKKNWRVAVSGIRSSACMNTKIA